MKNLLLILALTSFAFAGAMQKDQPKKSTATKTTAAKKSPTPSKKNTASKPSATASKKDTSTKRSTPSKKTGSASSKNETEKKSASTTKKRPADQSSSSSAKKDAATKKTTANDRSAATTTKPKPNRPTTRKDDKGDLEKALAIEDQEKRIAALTKFLANYPGSSLRPRALESLTAERVALGDTKLAAGDRDNGLKLIRLAIREAPVPYPEQLFAEIISKVPSGLYRRGEQAAAHEVAADIETKSASSAPRLLMLAGFYLATENGDAAKRLAEAAIKLDEKSAAAYQALGMANRLNFDLEASSTAFTKAVELDPDSAPSRRSLADMKRALGRSEDALTLYKELLTKDPDDLQSQTGLILSLFEAGKRTDAEAELSRSIEAYPGNFVLLAGAAWWYVSNGDSAKAIDLAGKAMSAEPRYVWSHIALARAYSGEGRFADAEQALLKAKSYGNFATLEYELASVKFASGFFREAADELQKSFIVKDGAVSTKLGRRIERSEKNFADLVAQERRASILLPSGGDSVENSERMKALFELRLLLAQGSPDSAKAATLADAFVSGNDGMRYHRQIFAATALLEKQIAPEKALELSRSAVSGVDDGLSVPSPAGPILASELYASRAAAERADRYEIVPDLPKQILSAIARGRIEELAGWSLMQQGNRAEAVVRLRRAVSILPEKSAWWRSSMWRLGTALEADGKMKEALETYVKTYTSAEPDAERYAAIQAVFVRVNGNTEGLGELIGKDPAKPADKTTESSGATQTETKKETEASPVVEKVATSVEDKTPEPKKSVESIPEIPTSVPVETSKKTEVTSTEQKAPEKTEAPPGDLKADEKQPEPKVLPDKVVETPTPSPTENQKKTESQPVEEKPVPPVSEPPPPVTKVEEKTDNTTTSAEKETEKPLFEPVVIEVKSNPVKSSKTEERAAEPDDKGSRRRARVVEDKDSTEGAPPPCNLVVSQENISLIADGGSIGVLVGVDGEADLKQLKGATSSPKDLAVNREPEIAGVANRAYFLIKSLTNAGGEYKVSFSAPCGKKEISVKVR